MHAQPRTGFAGAVTAAVLALLTLSGCSLFQPVPGTDNGNIALDFTLEDGSGVSHSLSDYAGSVVWIQFLNVSSLPCQQEAEDSMALFHDPYASEGLVILTVLAGNNEDGDPVAAGDAVAWAQRYGIEYPVLYDGWTGGPWEDYRELWTGGTYYVPLNVIVNRDGIIWHKSKATEGYSPGGTAIRNVILPLLAK